MIFYFGSESAPHNASGQVIAPPRDTWKTTIAEAKTQGPVVYQVTDRVVCAAVTVRQFRDVPVAPMPEPPPPSEAAKAAPVIPWMPRRPLTAELLFRAYDVARDFRRERVPTPEELEYGIREVLS
jgi:hypothetical protein